MNNNDALKNILNQVKIFGDNHILPINEDLNIAGFAFIDNFSFEKGAQFFTYLAEAILNNCDFGFIDKKIDQNDSLSVCNATLSADVFIFLFLHNSNSNESLKELVATFNRIIKQLSQKKPSISLIFNNQISPDEIESNTILTFSDDSLESIAASILFLSKEKPLEILEYNEFCYKN